MSNMSILPQNFFFVSPTKALHQLDNTSHFSIHSALYNHVPIYVPMEPLSVGMHHKMNHIKCINPLVL